MDQNHPKAKTIDITTNVNLFPNFYLGLALGSFYVAITIYCVVRSCKESGRLFYNSRPLWYPYTSDLAVPNLKHTRMTLDHEDICTLHDPDEDPLPATRSQFGSIGTIVYGWPSTGGVWVHESCFAVELDFLGISRFEPSPTMRYSKEEDEFCHRLERIGGSFYESEYAYNSHRNDAQTVFTWYGWPEAAPEGGVWALRTKRFEAAEVGVSRIRNALTMEERCKAIEMLGGKFFNKFEDLPWHTARQNPDAH